MDAFAKLATENFKTVIRANIPRICADEPGGWFVVIRGGKFGWLYGSRKEALAAARELVEEWR